MKSIILLVLTFVSFFPSHAAVNLSAIEGKDLMSQKVLKSDTSKKYHVFFFLNASCPCSQAHFDHLNQLKQLYPDYEFLAFHSNKDLDPKEAKAYYSKLKINFPILDDKQLTFANIFKALKTPHVFVTDSNGKVVFQGGATNSRNPNTATQFYLRNTLNELQSNKPVSKPVAKTIGCYITR